MIGRLFPSSEGGAPAAPATPRGTRLYAIGDIHGRDDLLAQLTLLVHEDAYRRKAPRNVVIYLGDYVDRGPDSRAVIERLLRAPLPGFESVHLKGNHEDFMLRFLDDIGVASGWLTYGGMETLESYGVEAPSPHAPPAELLRAQEGLRRALPQEHLGFLRGLRLSHEEGDYAFVHAGVRPGVPFAAQRADDMLWIRDEFLQSQASFGRVVVHGHSITSDPDVRTNRIGIDTGAFASGRLTALVAEGTEWYFLQT
ncbi:MAG TPA: metallophosphoesterase [Stellaceae bacterium]|nr:metallophosphoesterase [Stellaceae bacterium]